MRDGVWGVVFEGLNVGSLLKQITQGVTLVHKFALLSKLNKFRPFPSPSLFTQPVLPMGSAEAFASCLSVASSAWLAINLCPLDFSLPTICPHEGEPSRLKSTV